MEVTKCDRCGSYVDKRAGEIPTIIYSGSYNQYKRGDLTCKNICYECYNRFLDWVAPFDQEEKKESWE